MNTVTDKPVFEFAGFRLDAAQRRLQGPDGQPIPLAARAFDTLLYLLEHPGALLDKDTLMQAVWPNVIVAENNLNQAITQLRHAIGEEHIVTIPGRGYQFVTPVNRLTAAPLPDQQPVSSTDIPIESSGATENRKQPMVRGTAALLVGVVVVILLYLFWQRPPTAPVSEETQKGTVTTTPPQTVTVVGASLQSVAVLPFADMSPNKDQEYFADGVAEEVLNQLSQIRDLFVVGRTSSI